MRAKKGEFELKRLLRIESAQSGLLCVSVFCYVVSLFKYLVGSSGCACLFSVQLSMCLKIRLVFFVSSLLSLCVEDLKHWF